MSRQPPKKVRSCPTAALVYLTAVLGVWLARNGIAERTWWSVLLLYAPPVLFGTPLVVLLPFALFRKDRRAIALHGLSLVVLMGPVMGVVANRPQPASAAERRVRVLTYNIYGGDMGYPHIAEQVRRFEPDVVVFEEARKLREVAALPPELRGVFSGWSAVYRNDMFVASRWPVVESESKPLAGSKYRSRVRATIAAPFGRFHVMGVHFYTRTASNQTSVLSAPPKVLWDSAVARQREMDDVLQALAKLHGPVILAGDFNNPPAGGVYQRLTSTLRDSFHESGNGWGYTFPSPLPVWRIDYVFHSAEWRVGRVEVGGPRGSDHRPLFSELYLAKS